MAQIKIISEIGSNHNGDIELAKKMIDVSAACGADYVKFQTFKTTELVSNYAPMAEYQKKNLEVEETQLDMLSKLELSYDDYRKLFAYADSIGIEMFSTPFDLESVEFLASIGQKIWKIPSGEITNLPFLERVAELPIESKHMILSTGMASMDEIEQAVSVLANGIGRITIMHCNTNYPSRDEDLHLNAIRQLQDFFPECDIALSDHSKGITAALVACSMGITMIEKHFTLSNDLPGPDHKASMTPDELRALCAEVHRAEKMLGQHNKVVTESELPNRLWARKSIVAKLAIREGEIFSSENLTCKRPGNGINPMRWYDVVGRYAERDFDMDEMITISDIE